MKPWVYFLQSFGTPDLPDCTGRAPDKKTSTLAQILVSYEESGDPGYAFLRGLDGRGRLDGRGSLDGHCRLRV